MPRINRELTDATLEVVHACALRFDGYRWLQAQGKDTADGFEPCMQSVVSTLCARAEAVENFAAFFALQRWLFKWGGQSLPLSALEHTAFRLLFLHLWNSPTPRGFEHPEYDRKWYLTHPGRIQSATTEVRQFIRASRRQLKGRKKPCTSPRKQND